MFASVLKSVEVLLLNMCNLLELSGLFVCLGVLVKFFSALEGGGEGSRKNNCGLLGGISIQADTMDHSDQRTLKLDVSQ